jgi:hypothetical protein
MRELPSTVLIGSRIFPVRVVAGLIHPDNPEQEMLGLFSEDPSHYGILLEASLLPNQVFDILFHEIIHAVIWEYGLVHPDLDAELPTRQWTNAILALLRANPALIGLLQSLEELQDIAHQQAGHGS